MSTPRFVDCGKHFGKRAARLGEVALPVLPLSIFWGVAHNAGAIVCRMTVPAPGSPCELFLSTSRTEPSFGCTVCCLTNHSFPPIITPTLLLNGSASGGWLTTFVTGIGSQCPTFDILHPWIFGTGLSGWFRDSLDYSKKTYNESNASSPLGELPKPSSMMVVISGCRLTSLRSHQEKILDA